MVCQLVVAEGRQAQCLISSLGSHRVSIATWSFQVMSSMLCWCCYSRCQCLIWRTSSEPCVIVSSLDCTCSLLFHVQILFLPTHFSIVCKLACLAFSGWNQSSICCFHRRTVLNLCLSKSSKIWWKWILQKGRWGRAARVGEPSEQWGSPCPGSTNTASATPGQPATFGKQGFVEHRHTHSSMYYL